MFPTSELATWHWITGCLLTFIYAYAFGTSVARAETSFLVFASEDGTVCAVIRVRDQGLLCVNFDPASKQIEGRYHFLRPDAAALSLVKTGRLGAPLELINDKASHEADERPYWLRESL